MRVFWLMFLVMGAWPVWGQGVAPREVVASAVAAVESLGKRVVMGDHKVAIESMYPQWKARMAKRKGGIERLERELEGIGAEMARNGMSIISVRTEGVPRAYEVWPGKQAAGTDVEVTPVFDKWLLLVPTVTRLRVMSGEAPNLQTVDIDIQGFQVAISNKEPLQWTFINGSDITVSDLRSLFASLPANMELPEVKRKVVE